MNRDGGVATRTFAGPVSSPSSCARSMPSIAAPSISCSTAIRSNSHLTKPRRWPAWTACWRRTQAEVQALASFAKAGTNRIVLIPGDRDSALRFGKVAERVTRALGGSADRVTAASSGYWVSRDGKVHAEHGHEIRFRTQDSGALQELYDKLEARYPAVDNVAIAASGAKYGLAADEHAVVRRGRRAPRARHAPECLLAAVPDGA